MKTNLLFTCKSLIFFHIVNDNSWLLISICEDKIWLIAFNDLRAKEQELQVSVVVG